MPEKLAEKLYLKKVLNRWENEGGRIFVEQAEPRSNSLFDEHQARLALDGKRRKSSGALDKPPEAKAAG